MKMGGKIVNKREPDKSDHISDTKKEQAHDGDPLAVTNPEQEAHKKKPVVGKALTPTRSLIPGEKPPSLLRVLPERPVVLPGYRPTREVLPSNIKEPKNIVVFETDQSSKEKSRPESNRKRLCSYQQPEKDCNSETRRLREKST